MPQIANFSFDSLKQEIEAYLTIPFYKKILYKTVNFCNHLELMIAQNIIRYPLDFINYTHFYEALLNQILAFSCPLEQVIAQGMLRNRLGYLHHTLSNNYDSISNQAPQGRVERLVFELSDNATAIPDKANWQEIIPYISAVSYEESTAEKSNWICIERYQITQDKNEESAYVAIDVSDTIAP